MYASPSRARNARSEKAPTSRTGPTRLIAFAVPGLARLLAEELDSMAGVRVEDTGRDGRADVVLFTAEPSAFQQVITARLAEDIFVEIGRTLRSDGDRAQWIAGRLWRPERARRALAARARMTRPAKERTTFRVIARVLQERSFLRTELRRHLADTIQRHQPNWRFSDPADVEVWVVEYKPGKIVAGLRVSDVRMRQHDGRDVERGGALRPTVAAAMVQLAGSPAGVLLDPCCGSGTILIEGAAVGWHGRGIDIDPGAVRIARKNAPDAEVSEGDVRQLPCADSSVRTCVSNLPFGKQYTVEQDMNHWLRAALSELDRVTQPGGRVVLLAPDIPRSVTPAGLALTMRVPIRLLGAKTTIWAYDRRSRTDTTAHSRSESVNLV
jgi:tRNA G10  N-methylase Trm11